MSVRSLDVAATGMQAQQHNVDTISHNLANLNTVGYKESRLAFEDLLYQTESRVGSLVSEGGDRLPSGIYFGLGAAISGVSKNFEQGALSSTPSSPLNVAISGRGFLQVTLPDGNIGLTRDGTLQVNQDGQIVTAQGYVVSPGITVPDNAISTTITRDGRVQVSVPGQQNPVELGQFELATVVNPAGLEAIGNNIYKETPAAGTLITGIADSEGLGFIKQHFLENSNVNSIKEMTDLIKAQRAYEMNSKLIQASEQMLKTATDAKA